MHNSSPGSVNIASSDRGPVDRSSTFEDEEIDIVEEENTKRPVATSTSRQTRCVLSLKRLTVLWMDTHVDT